MKVLKFILVLLCAAGLLRLAACTTGLAPTPQATPEITPISPSTEKSMDQPGQPQTESETAPVVDPARARDAALAALLTEIPDAGSEAEVPDAVEWEVEDATPQNLVGAVTTIYRGGGWEVLVRYPVVAPANTRYTVEIQNLNTGMGWEVVLDAHFQPLSLNPISP